MRMLRFTALYIYVCTSIICMYMGFVLRVENGGLWFFSIEEKYYLVTEATNLFALNIFEP